MYEIVILACENGTYGYDCNNTCGHCTDKESCFHTNGTCRFGCNPGYMGELCKTGMFFMYRTRYRQSLLLKLLYFSELNVLSFFLSPV